MESDLSTRDYGKIADALEQVRPLVDSEGRERCIVIIGLPVLQYVCEGLRRLNQLDAPSAHVNTETVSRAAAVAARDRVQL
ncbi:MAG TPA: hypothetical protein VLZ74_15495 [Methylocella sp.]|nr:hypothetical protein [Methylocella sp.]